MLNLNEGGGIWDMEGDVLDGGWGLVDLGCHFNIIPKKPHKLLMSSFLFSTMLVFEDRAN